MAFCLAGRVCGAGVLQRLQRRMHTPFMDLSQIRFFTAGSRSHCAGRRFSVRQLFGIYPTLQQRFTPLQKLRLFHSSCKKRATESEGAGGGTTPGKQAPLVVTPRLLGLLLVCSAGVGGICGLILFSLLDWENNGRGGAPVSEGEDVIGDSWFSRREAFSEYVLKHGKMAAESEAPEHSEEFSDLVGYDLQSVESSENKKLDEKKMNRTINKDLCGAIKQAMPSLVHIIAEEKDPSGRVMCSSGSGFIIDRKGLILTNSHVVDSHCKVSVILQDGREYYGVVQGLDYDNDLTIIKILGRKEESSSNKEGKQNACDSQETGKVSKDEEFPTAQLGYSSTLKQGEMVIAMGTPLSLSNTVTMGIVSSLNRDAHNIGLRGTAKYIQTDCAINTGNSGGPLIDLNGSVVGINTVKAEGSGISFAIPIDCAREFIHRWRERPSLHRPYIGCKLLSLDESLYTELCKEDKHFPRTASGVFVPYVKPNSPADKGGMIQGDVIVGVNGIPITSVAQLYAVLERGDDCSFEVIRRYQLKKYLTIVPQAPFIPH
eukprot:Nk52_evm46s2152 gene=Nk52_evmTU46s2152